MGLFDNMRVPVFLKENSSVKEQIIDLTAMLQDAPREIKAKMEQDLKILSAELRTENQVALELKNSHIPMFVFWDLRLCHGGLAARMDFLVITRTRNFVLECRDLFGDIEINGGDFFRTTDFGGSRVKERICSPVISSRRSLELIRKIRSADMDNPISMLLFQKKFFDNYRSAAVLADSGAGFTAKYAKKEIAGQVIPVGQLAQHIKKLNAEPLAAAGREKDAEQLAFSFLALQRETPKDFTEKYRLMLDGPRSKEAE